MAHPGVTSGRLVRALAAMLLAAALIAPATPVLAWGTSGDGYGSHDWVIDQAVRVLDGRAAWFDAAVARSYSDDPDTVEVRTPNENEHVYRFVGRRGGAVGRAADEFDLAMAAHQAAIAAETAGDQAAADAANRDASMHIGLMSHFVADVAQPFHTAYAGIGKDALHASYELLVNNAQRTPGSRPDWQSTRRTPAVTANVRTTVTGTARYSAGYFSELYTRLKADGVRLTTRIAQITGAVMRRATNDLADLIWSIDRGVGAQPAIGSLKMTLRWTGIRSGDNQLLTVKAIDVNGRPIEGLKVVVKWPTSTGTRTEYLYTDGTGYQQRYASVGTSPRLVLRPVVGTARVRGTVTTVSKAWTISPRLATGAAGFKTIVSDSTVVPGQEVRVTSIARDANGKGVPNLLVTWTWDFNGVKSTSRAYTDTSGRASSTRVVSETTTMVTVKVTAKTQAGSTNRTSVTSFRRVA